MKKNVVSNNESDEYEDHLVRNVKAGSSQFDESIEVVGADDVRSPPSSAGVISSKMIGRETNSPSQHNLKKEKTNNSVQNTQWQKKDRNFIGQLSDNLGNWEDEDEDDDDEEDDDDDDDDVRAPIVQGAYDPNDYDQLVVSEDIKEIFGYITKYTPQNIELENKLCPFLPDFIPAVGDLDAFIKVPRPDGKPDGLGLTVLDEPCTQQSDPAVLQLQLRAVDKQFSAKTIVVKKIENAEKNAKSIEKWIKAISDLHSTKHSPTVQYSKPMPNMDNLMQEWPTEIEEKLNNIAIPSPELDCDLSTYVTIICNLFDIPVYESKIQSLHAFFSFYSTMKSTQGQLIRSQNE